MKFGQNAVLQHHELIRTIVSIDLIHVRELSWKGNRLNDSRNAFNKGLKPLQCYLQPAIPTTSKVWQVINCCPSYARPLVSRPCKGRKLEISWQINLATVVFLLSRILIINPPPLESQ